MAPGSALIAVLLALLVAPGDPWGVADADLDEVVSFCRLGGVPEPEAMALGAPPLSSGWLGADSCARPLAAEGAWQRFSAPLVPAVGGGAALPAFSGSCGPFVSAHQQLARRARRRLPLPLCSDPCRGATGRAPVCCSQLRWGPAVGRMSTRHRLEGQGLAKGGTSLSPRPLTWHLSIRPDRGSRMGAASR